MVITIRYSSRLLIGYWTPWHKTDIGIKRRNYSASQINISADKLFIIIDRRVNNRTKSVDYRRHHKRSLRLRAYTLPVVSAAAMAGMLDTLE